MNFIDGDGITKVYIPVHPWIAELSLELCKVSYIHLQYHKCQSIKVGLPLRSSKLNQFSLNKGINFDVVFK